MNHETAKLPKPLYGCASEGCSEEYSFPAEDLAWFSGNEDLKPGWYCFNCVDWVEAECDGPRLDEEIKRRGLSR